MAVFLQVQSPTTQHDSVLAEAVRGLAPHVGLGALAFSAAVSGTADTSHPLTLPNATSSSSEVASSLPLHIETSMHPDTSSGGISEEDDHSQGDSSSKELLSLAVRSIFDEAVVARGEQREQLLETLREYSTVAVVEASLAAFRERGNTDRLDLACQVLEATGRKSLPALELLAQDAGPGQSAFVALAAYAPFLTSDERSRLLASFASSSDHETRTELLHIAGSVADAEIQHTLELLARDSDEDIAAEASDELELLLERAHLALEQLPASA